MSGFDMGGGSVVAEPDGPPPGGPAATSLDLFDAGVGFVFTGLTFALGRMGSGVALLESQVVGAVLIRGQFLPLYEGRVFIQPPPMPIITWMGLYFQRMIDVIMGVNSVDASEALLTIDEALALGLGPPFAMIDEAIVNDAGPITFTGPRVTSSSFSLGMPGTGPAGQGFAFSMNPNGVITNVWGDPVGHSAIGPPAAVTADPTVTSDTGITLGDE